MDRPTLLTEIDFIGGEIERLKKQAKKLPVEGWTEWRGEIVQPSSIMFRSRIVNDIIKIRRELNDLRIEVERELTT